MIINSTITELPHLSDDDNIITSSMALPTTSTDTHIPDSSLSYHSMNIGTLNCRGLTKSTDPSIRSNFIRYMRTRSFDLLALQETHAASPILQDLFHSQFQASSSLWSQHCGLIIFSPDLNFSNSFISLCGRIITATVSHISQIFDPVTISVIYAPAQRADRYSFFSDLFTDNVDASSLFPHNPSRYIILGDFNYSYSRQTTSSQIRQAPTSWLQYIDDYFVDSITSPTDFPAFTFQRGSSRSCIDYIFVSNDLSSSIQYTQSSTTLIPVIWTDHLLLTTNLRLYPPINRSSSAQAVGKGLWRAHPRLASNSNFRRKLHKSLSKCVQSLGQDLSAAEKWEKLKRHTAQVCRSFSRKQAFTLTRAEDLLHKKRAGILKKLRRNPEDLPILNPQLMIVEQQLSALQQYHVETLALRSSVRWRELGELSPGYLKRSVQSRAARQLIPPLIHPVTATLCTTTNEMLETATSFYTDLYSPDPINQNSLNSLLSSLPENLHISDQDALGMIDPITIDDLLDAFSRSPKKSSPGMDGLPYQIVRLIILHPDCREISLATFNNALTFSDIPSSWLQSCVSLLPKKPPLDTLKNFRPISLINTDAKVFTRILSNRMISTASSIITPYQTGFVRGRFIADNGLLMKLIMEHAVISGSTSIGLLLDQEKAYDRVHPEYLRAVLLRFGYPLSLVNCIDKLFFGNQLHINVNGFISPSVHQQRGLKQGDPISPILFNLAFEPLLRTILADPRLQGYILPGPLTPNPVKLMAYADDIVCMLNSPAELSTLHSHLNTYSLASNALVNFHKTEAISLSGASSIYITHWQEALLSHRITSWHDCRSMKPIIYLGFPLFTSVAQRNSFLDHLLEKIRNACFIHQGRGLSVRGRSTVLNSLILSKLWHVLRVITVPKSFLSKVQTVIANFVNFRIFPNISFETICLPRKVGGLGLLNPTIQQAALQLRWLVPIITTPWQSLDTHPSFSNSIVLSRIIYFVRSCFPEIPYANLLPSSSSSFDHRLLFLFPDKRPPCLRKLTSSLSLLFQAMDRLPKDYHDVTISATTCLEIPFGSIVRKQFDSSINTLSRSVSTLPCIAGYTLNHETFQCLRPRERHESIGFPTLSNKIKRLVSTEGIVLEDFFVRAFLPVHTNNLDSSPLDNLAFDISPFLVSLQFIETDGILSNKLTTTKDFRKLCLSPRSPNTKPNLPIPYSPSIYFPWAKFWALPLPHTCRNIWYRVIQYKLPSKSILHRFVPEAFPSPSCLICSHPIENYHHFLFECPAKLQAWQYVWHTYVDTSVPRVSVATLDFTLRTLIIHSSKPPNLFGDHILALATILSSIWSAHWAFVFNDIPLTTATILSLFQRNIGRTRREHLISAGIPHSPPPFFNIED